MATERLLEIDLLSLRPLRAKLAGTATQNDTDKLLELEAEAESLRELFKTEEDEKIYNETEAEIEAKREEIRGLEDER